MSDETKTPIDEETKDDDLDLDDLDIDDLDLDDEDEAEEEEEDTKEDDSAKKADDDKDTAANIQRKKWRDRAQKAEAALAELKQKPTKTVSKETDTKGVSAERTDFRFDHPELTTSEVNEVEAIAKAKGVSLEDAMKSPLIRVYLKVSARKRSHQSASPESRHQTIPRPKGKDVNAMSTEDFEAFKRRVKSGEKM